MADEEKRPETETDRKGDGRFAKGNEIWRHGLARSLATKRGAQRKYENGEALLEAVMPYFEWVAANPYKIQQGSVSGGAPVVYDIVKQRPMSLESMRVFVGMSRETWDSMLNQENYQPEAQWIREVIMSDKLDGAVAGLYNANIVMKQAGLADMIQISGAGGGPIETRDMTKRQAILDEARRLGIDVAALGLTDKDDD